MIPNREEVRNEVNSIKIEISLLVFGVLAVIFSLLISYIDCDASWFGRSGSILVFCCAVVEARCYGAELKILSAFKKASDYLGGASGNWEVPDKRRKLEIFTIVLAVLGTIIWGYGDLWPIEI